jgi:hypothetical protein
MTFLGMKQVSMISELLSRGKKSRIHDDYEGVCVTDALLHTLDLTREGNCSSAWS